MVRYYLIKNKNNLLTYEYYPEDDKKKEAGLIVANLKDNEIEIVKVAEGDYGLYISAEERNEFIDSINEMILESGEGELFEYVSEPIREARYGLHAINGICKELRKGDIPEKGIVMWY